MSSVNNRPNHFMVLRDFKRDEVRKEGLFWRQEGEKQ